MNIVSALSLGLWLPKQAMPLPPALRRRLVDIFHKHDAQELSVLIVAVLTRWQAVEPAVLAGRILPACRACHDNPVAAVEALDAAWRVGRDRVCQDVAAVVDDIDFHVLEELQRADQAADPTSTPRLCACTSDEFYRVLDVAQNMDVRIDNQGRVLTPVSAILRYVTRGTLDELGYAACPHCQSPLSDTRQVRCRCGQEVFCSTLCCESDLTHCCNAYVDSAKRLVLHIADLEVALLSCAGHAMPSFSTGGLRPFAAMWFRDLDLFDCATLWRVSSLVRRLLSVRRRSITPFSHPNN